MAGNDEVAVQEAIKVQAAGVSLDTGYPNLTHSIGEAALKPPLPGVLVVLVLSVVALVESVVISVVFSFVSSFSAASSSRAKDAIYAIKLLAFSVFVYCKC